MWKHENGFKQSLLQLTTNAELVKKYNIKDAKTFGRFIVDYDLISNYSRQKENITQLENKVEELTDKLINYAAMIEQITEKMKTGE